MSAKSTERTSIGSAVHGMWLDLRLQQAELAAMLDVTRETVSGWERGRTIPPIEQRQKVLTRLKDAPAASLDRLAHAFGLSVARPQPATPIAAARSAASVRAAMTNAVRAAADDLDVAPSAVRRTLAAVLRRMRELGVRPEEMESALSMDKPRG